MELYLLREAFSLHFVNASVLRLVFFLAARDPGPLALNPAWCLDVLFSYFSRTGLGVSTVSSLALLLPWTWHSAPTWAGWLTAGIFKVASMLEQRRPEDGHLSQARVVWTLSSSRQHRPHRPGRGMLFTRVVRPATCLRGLQVVGVYTYCLTLALLKNLSCFLPSTISLVCFNPGLKPFCSLLGQCFSGVLDP